jgi:hypothetical protein
MKKYYYLLLLLVLGACFTQRPVLNNSENAEKPVVISNDSLEYQIIILDMGFNTYLNSIAKPMTFYSDAYYKIRNDRYVNEWNRNVINPRPGFRNVFEQTIDYDESIDYGIEVNYQLYNYFKFVEYKYRYKFSF